jgi:hypothetical protein
VAGVRCAIPRRINGVRLAITRHGAVRAAHRGPRAGVGVDASSASAPPHVVI